MATGRVVGIALLWFIAGMLFEIWIGHMRNDRVQKECEAGWRPACALLSDLARVDNDRLLMKRDERNAPDLGGPP
jgi:hypothetical protein